MNFVVADDNLYFAKSFVNYLLEQYSELKLIKICSNGLEVIETLKTVNVDILILDLAMPKLGGIEILNMISELHLIKKPIILVISGKTELIKKLIDNPLVYLYISKSTSLDYISLKIKDILKQFNYDTIKEKVYHELLSLRFNFKYLGTTYIMESILLKYEYKDSIFENNLEKYLYKNIAYKYKKSIANIKTNIFKATNMMYAECDQKFLKNYFNFDYDVKPTPKIIINTVAAKIKAK